MSNYPDGVTIHDLPETSYSSEVEISEAEKRLNRIIANHWRRKNAEAYRKFKSSSSIRPEHINL